MGAERVAWKVGELLRQWEGRDGNVCEDGDEGGKGVRRDSG